jgi:hypothetical protein
MRAGVAQGGLVSPVLFSLYAKDIATTHPPRRASAARGRHGSHSHVPQSIASPRVSGGLPQ